MRPILAVLACLVTLPTTTHSQEILGRSDRVFSRSEPVPQGGRVGVFTAMGRITVTEASGSTLEFRAEKDDRRGDVRDIGFIVRKSSGGVTICAIYDDDDDCRDTGISAEGRRSRRWSERARVDITVSVPRGAILTTASGNGEVSVSAALAEAKVSSGNGRVRVSGVTGRLDVSTGNGELTIEGVGGPVIASTGNGDVSVTATNGPVGVSSGNGDIFVSMSRLAGSDDLSFTSGNGRVEIEVPSDFGAELQANTGNGRITTDFPITVTGRITPSRLRGTLGAGGRRLTITTGNGAIEIRKKA